MNEDVKAIKRLEEKTKDYTLSGEDLHYALILYHLIINLQQENKELQNKIHTLEDELEWYKQECDDLEMRIGLDE